jgi:hypothetical protein
LIVGTNTEPLKLHFNDFMKKIAEDQLHFNDSKSDILKNDSIDLFFLTKKLVDSIFKTVGIRNNDYVFLEQK